MEKFENEVNENVEIQEISKKKIEKTVLDNFSKLTNVHENVRVKSAVNLLRYLAENPETNELNELKYALKRLIRGLGADSFPARAGYYSTLVGLLNSQQSITSNDILEIVKTELHRSGKNSDSENADIRLGQILACGAIMHTDLWVKSNEDQQKEIIQLVLTAGSERVYLKLFGYNFLIELLKTYPNINNNEILMDLIKTEITKPWKEQTMDSLYLILTLKTLYPNSYNAKFVKTFLETSDIICKGSIEHLGNILMEIPRSNSLNHPIYEEILKHVTPNLFAELFIELDKHLRTPNRNRLMVFLKITNNTLIYMMETEKFTEQIEEILTRNFITQLLAYYRTFRGKQRDKQFHESVQKFFENLAKVLEKESISSERKISVIKKLLFDPGTFVFEKVTKSKIIQKITSSLNAEGVKKLALVYKGVIEGTEEINSENSSEIWLNNDRLYSAHLLIKLFSIPIMKLDNDEWKFEQLKFIMEISLFRELNGFNIGRELAESLKAAFFGSLDLKLSKLDELHSILLKLVQYIDSKINLENISTILRTPINEETYALWQKSLNVIKKIGKKQKKTGINSVFLTLFLQMSLQLFNDVKLATDSLNELFSCYGKVKEDKKARRSSQKFEESSSTAEEDPLWLEVVIDLFLNLLSHNSHLLRSIINSVFPHLCQFMTSTTISQILQVLDTQNEENPLSKDAAESSSDSEDDDDDDDDDDDEEKDSSSESEDEDKVSDDETVTDKLRMALHQVLSSNGHGNNKKSDDDEESIDLDEMSDTEGEKLDQALAEAFRKFKPNRGKNKKQNKDQETLTHFRVRVLDLIEIYLDSNPSMLLTLEIMLPLLQAVEFSIRDEHQKPLNERLKSVLKKLLSLKKFSNIDGVNDEVLVDLLKSLLDKGSKNILIVQEMGEQISDCCIFVIKCSDMIRNLETTSSKLKKKILLHILEIVSGELSQFFTKRDSLTPYVFFKNLIQINWEGSIGLVVILLEFMFSEEIRQFKKNQVSELLKLFYSNQRFFSIFKEQAEKKMCEAHEKFSQNVVEYFKLLCSEPDRKNIKEKFICNFFNLLTALKTANFDHSVIKWSEIAEIIREYRSYKSFSKDAKISFNKLCTSLGVSNIVKMKNQLTKLSPLINSAADDNDDDDDIHDENKKIDKKKKQKRKTNDTLKLKKEAKKLRLEGLSNGLQESAFKNGFNEEVDNENDDDDVQEKIVAKKNKKLENGFNKECDDEEIIEENVQPKVSRKKKKLENGDLTNSTCSKKKKLSKN